MGYGDFRNAEVLVLSKHEGADNGLLRQEIEAREEYYGLDKEYWLDGENRLGGYWHPSTQSGGDIINELTGNAKPDGPIPFVVNFPSRIILALREAFENKSATEIDRWFHQLGSDETSETIKDMYKEIYSYQHVNGNWRAALSHYQPLPRENGTWPYPEFDHAAYESVYGATLEHEDPFFKSIRDKREALLADVLRAYPKKLIFSTGNFVSNNETDAVRNFFEKEFQTKFSPFRLGGRRRGLIGEFTYNGQKTIVVHTQGFAFGGGLGRNHVRLITRAVFSKLQGLTELSR